MINQRSLWSYVGGDLPCMVANVTVYGSVAIKTILGNLENWKNNINLTCNWLQEIVMRITYWKLHSDPQNISWLQRRNSTVPNQCLSQPFTHKVFTTKLCTTKLCSMHIINNQSSKHWYLVSTLSPIQSPNSALLTTQRIKSS